MISYRKYKILKALVKLRNNKKIDEDKRNQLITSCGGNATEIYYLNVDISDIKAILKEKYSDDVLIYELHDLGEHEYVRIDGNDKNKVLYYSVNVKGIVAVEDYYKSLIWKSVRNIIIPAIVSIIVSLIVS